MMVDSTTRMAISKKDRAMETGTILNQQAINMNNTPVPINTERMHISKHSKATVNHMASPTVSSSPTNSTSMTLVTEVKVNL